jgi:TatD DNase family protein
VGRLVEVGDSPEDWPKVLALCRAAGPAQAVRCALGLHPYYAESCSESLLCRLEQEALAPEVAAIGEIGLDYARTQVAPQVQQAALRRLLAACRSAGKPAVIHCREAYADLRLILRELFPSPPGDRRFWGVVHCFSGAPEDAEALVASGWAVGADGPVTYPKNEALREAFRRAGPGAAVLETDSPYLPPQSLRGKRNEPAAVPEIAATLAALWGLSLEETARRTSGNAEELFGWGDRGHNT